ncbi:MULTISPECIES: hypothetical protein [unclassified Mesorhizobium]|uniref:hypothetical protein n=1 Tax=unclassified Mesorhizobium TaxID=325217 RepID=UPI00333DF9A8
MALKSLPKPAFEPTRIAIGRRDPLDVDGVAQIVYQRAPDWIDSMDPFKTKRSNHARAKSHGLARQPTKIGQEQLSRLQMKTHFIFDPRQIPQTWFRRCVCASEVITGAPDIPKCAQDSSCRAWKIAYWKNLVEQIRTSQCRAHADLDTFA